MNDLPVFPPVLARAAAHIAQPINYYTLSIPVDELFAHINPDRVEMTLPVLLRANHGARHLMTLDNSVRYIAGERMPSVFVDDQTVWIRLCYNDDSINTIPTDRERNDCNLLLNGLVSDLPIPNRPAVGGIQKCSLRDMEDAFRAMLGREAEVDLYQPW